MRISRRPSVTVSPGVSSACSCDTAAPGPSWGTPSHAEVRCSAASSGHTSSSARSRNSPSASRWLALAAPLAAAALGVAGVVALGAHASDRSSASACSSWSSPILSAAARSGLPAAPSVDFSDGGAGGQGWLGLPERDDAGLVVAVPPQRRRASAPRYSRYCCRDSSSSASRRLCASRKRSVCSICVALGHSSARTAAKKSCTYAGSRSTPDSRSSAAAAAP
mmetsp:Transcript_24350/g.76340  ORF Transcript_24350/g.76340 Transcript_24350/m.76340 type:complete len:222 (+) Transcript_24350:617-1282(+)